MYYHKDLQSRELRNLILAKKITFAGNKNLRIYGMLRCGSGKRMKQSNRVFFGSEKEAIDLGYRPCGHCMKRRKGTI